MEVESGFPRPHPSNFFRCKLLNVKTFNGRSRVHYKRRNEILKEKSMDKILNSSPVSIFFDKSFLAALRIKFSPLNSPNQTCANSATRQNKAVANEPFNASIRLPLESLECLIDMLDTSDSTYRLAPRLSFTFP